MFVMRKKKQKRIWKVCKEDLEYLGITPEFDYGYLNIWKFLLNWKFLYRIINKICRFKWEYKNIKIVSKEECELCKFKIYFSTHGYTKEELKGMELNYRREQ